MNNLKTARRSLMGNELLRTLMTICELGKEWEDPSQIPVDEIVEEWRSQSKKGRSTSRRCGDRPGLRSPMASGSRERAGRQQRGRVVSRWRLNLTASLATMAASAMGRSARARPSCARPSPQRHQTRSQSGTQTGTQVTSRIK